MEDSKVVYSCSKEIIEESEEPLCKKFKPETQPINDLYFNQNTRFDVGNSPCQTLHVLVSEPSNTHSLWNPSTTGNQDNEENFSSTDLNGSCDSSGIADCDVTENSSEELSVESNNSPDVVGQSTLSDADPDIIDYDDNSKQSLESDSPDYMTDSSSESKKRRVRFQKVQVYYFDRVQGFTCVPSQGGSTLGMKFQHWRQDDFPLSDYQLTRRQERRSILKKHYLQGKLQLCPEDKQMMEDVIHRDTNESIIENASIPSASSVKTDDSIDEEDLEDRLSYLEEFYFLQPVSVKKRRRMLKDAGTNKIERSERVHCQDVRQSRELCGCDCPNGVCLPETCQCAKWNIQCQVDRSNFPCSCVRQGCENPAGRLEFNPIRVKTHFIHTQMRLEMEKHGYDPSCESRDCTRSQDVSNFNSTEQGSCRDCQNQSYMHAIVQELRTAGLLPSVNPPMFPIPQPAPAPPIAYQPQPEQPIRFINSEENGCQTSNMYAVPAVNMNFHENADSVEDDDEEDVSSDNDEGAFVNNGVELQGAFADQCNSSELQTNFNCSGQSVHLMNSVNNERFVAPYHQFSAPMSSRMEQVVVMPCSGNQPALNYNSYNISQTSSPYAFCKLDPIDTLLPCTNPPTTQIDTDSPTSSMSTNLAPLLPSSSTQLADLHYGTEEISPVPPAGVPSGGESIDFMTSVSSVDVSIHSDTNSLNESADVSHQLSSQSPVSLGEILKKSIETAATV